MGKILSAFVFLVALGALLLLSGWEAKPALEQPVEYAVWSPYWTVQPGFTSTMEMKNNRAKETLRVVVSLYFSGGEEYHLDPISLGPRQTIVMNLNRVVESLPVSVAERAAKEGTAEVKFGGPNNAALMGSISVTNPERGIAWNFRLYPVKPTLAVTPVRGLFWFPDEDTDGFVAVQNASEEFITVLPRFQIASAYYSLAPISLGSGQGFKLELRKELRKLGLGEAMAGGIELSYQGPPDALKAHGVLFNNRGFSAEIDFTRSDSSPEPQVLALRTPRFAIGKADPALGLPAPTIFEPVLALHNFSTQGLAVTLSVGYRAGGIVKEAQVSISLPASNTRILSLRPYLEGVVPPDAHWASLEVSYRDRQNSLSGALVSVSQDGEHSIRSVLNGVQGSASDGWLWRADAEYNTLLGLMNTDTEEARVRVSLDYYAGGVRHSYKLPERTIPGRGSDLVDVGQIIASGIADSDGDVIPASVSFGGYSVRKIGRRIHTTLITEALVFNRRTQNFLTFYNTCCGPRDVQAVPYQIVGPLGITTQVDVEGTDSCSGSPVILTSSSTFSSSNIPVASVGTTTGTVSLVAPGTATIHTHLQYLQGAEYLNGHCISTTLDQDTPTSVTPVITSISPSRGLIGATTSSVTITGVGFTGGHVDTPAAIQVSNITTFTDTQIVADFVVASSATQGNNDVTITASGQQSNAKQFYVQVPTSLSIVSPKTGSEGPCQLITGPGCATVISFTYQVNDQNLPTPQPIQAVMSFWDSFGTTSPDPLQIDAHGGYTTTCGAIDPNLNNKGPCNVFTNSSGRFTEFALGACSPVCKVNGACTTGGPSQVNQTWHIGTSSIIQQISIYCEKVLVNGQ